jgi:hypothetical protein
VPSDWYPTDRYPTAPQVRHGRSYAEQRDGGTGVDLAAGDNEESGFESAPEVFVPANEASAAAAVAPPRRGRYMRLLIVAGIVAAVGASGGLVVAWRQTDAPLAAERTSEVRASEDTFIDLDTAPVSHSADPELVASSVPGERANAYLKFEVPELPEPGQITSVQVEVTSGSPQPGGTRLFTVPDTTWDSEEMVEVGPPEHGPLLASSPKAQSGVKTTFDVSQSVNGSGTYSFAIDSPDTRRRASWFSSENGVDWPRLIIVWRPHKPGKPGANAGGAVQPGLPSASVNPSAQPSVSGDPAAAGALPPLQPIPRGRSLAGASVQLQNGESFAQGLARADRTYGPLEVARVFYSGSPPSWKGSRAEVAARTVVVSFKMQPRDVNAGRHDSQLAAWFGSAPRNYDIYWSYWHEPEDDIEDGRFSAADYRAAWRRISGIAGRAGNPKLHPTLILMCFSLNPGSNRNWRDYYPGDDAVAALGWDCYNYGRKKGEYATPQSIFGKSIEVSRSVNKPFGYAEMGSALLPGDNGAGRAAWLRSVGAYLQGQGPLWMSYWDAAKDIDFRLLDAPSQQAWQAVCRS